MGFFGVSVRFKNYFEVYSFSWTTFVAKLSPKPLPQLWAEVAIFPNNPTTQPIHPHTHPEKFEFDLK